jgi:hypothetical protein
MTIAKQGVETFFFITLATAITLFVMVQTSRSKNTPVFSASAPKEDVPVPTVAPVGPVVSVMDSPEGSKTLSLERKENSEGATYSLFTSSKGDSDKQSIFQKNVIGYQSIEIPFNTWSPDTTYIFLKEKTSTIYDYLVFQSSGALFQNDSAFISLQELFSKKVPNYTIVDVTGWGGPQVLIVNVKSNDSDQKVSFWFDVQSQSFIQLGTYFK